MSTLGRQAHNPESYSRLECEALELACLRGPPGVKGLGKNKSPPQIAQGGGPRSDESQG